MQIGLRLYGADVQEFAFEAMSEVISLVVKDSDPFVEIFSWSVVSVSDSELDLLCLAINILVEATWARIWSGQRF